MKTFNMAPAPSVTFGAGSIAHVPEFVTHAGNEPVLVIADAALVTLGITERLTQPLTAKGIGFELAAEVDGEPKEALVDDLCSRVRDIGAQTVVGLGGGAAMDAAKLVAAIARSSLPAQAFALAARPIPNDGMPAIAIPTTAGTGSEVTRTAIISTHDGEKIWYWGEELVFKQALLDPELTVSLPPNLTAWTGMDAVAHALEGVTARRTNSAGHLYGIEALRILSASLPRVVAEGSNIKLRGEVLWGSMLAGLTLNNCDTHMGHNISHALGSLTQIHHGLASGLALEAVLPWLVARQEGQDNYALAAQALGGPPRAEALPRLFAELMRDCCIASELPDSCESVSQTALAKVMKSEANHRMTQNAACVVSAADIDMIAARMMSHRSNELAM